MTTWYERLLRSMNGRQQRGADAPAAATSVSRFIRHFRELSRGDLAVAGGKGANLGELIRAGFPVPDGFVVTTAAYDDFILKSGLAEAITGTPDNAYPSGEALRKSIEAVALPDDLASAVVAAYQQLGHGPVAVRSSATAEDLPHAAFAGQQDTFLNVLGPAALLAAVQRCWASLWTDRAVAYRARQGIDPRGIKLAVVVQRMIPAEVAGVLFTVHPVTGARDEIVIDASPGLGEAVVSGLATPDHYVLRRSHLGLRIVARRRGRREVLVRPRADGGTEQVSAPADEAPDPALPDATLRALARLGAAVARHFGGPRDVEWAVVSGTPWLLQARPITTWSTGRPAVNSLARVNTRSSADCAASAARPGPTRARAKRSAPGVERAEERIERVPLPLREALHPTVELVLGRLAHSPSCLLRRRRRLPLAHAASAACAAGRPRVTAVAGVVLVRTDSARAERPHEHEATGNLRPRPPKPVQHRRHLLVLLGARTRSVTPGRRFCFGGRPGGERRRHPEQRVADEGGAEGGATL